MKKRGKKPAMGDNPMDSDYFFSLFNQSFVDF